MTVTNTEPLSSNLGMSEIRGKVVGPRAEAAIGARVRLSGRAGVFETEAKNRGGIAVYHLELLHGIYRLTAHHPQFGRFSGTVWLSSEPADFDLYLDPSLAPPMAENTAGLSPALSSAAPRTPWAYGGWLREALKRVLPVRVRDALRRRFGGLVSAAPLVAAPAGAGEAEVRQLDFRSPAVRARCQPFGAVRGMLTTPHGIQLSCAPGGEGGIEIPVDVDANAQNCLLLTARDIPSGGDPRGWVTWLRSGDTEERRAVSFSKQFVPGVDSVTTYRLVLTPRQGWSGHIRALSIQPMQPQIELRALALQSLPIEDLLATRGEDVQWATAGDEIRECSCSPVPDTLTRRWQVPAAGAALHLGFAVHEMSAGDSGCAVTFRARIEGQTAPLFERTLTPAERPDDRGWKDTVVDLNAYAGRAIALHLTTEAPSTDGEPPPFALWMEPELVPPARTDQRPNVIVISVDSLRRDRVGCYTGRADLTPHLDALAAGGTRFSAAWSTTRWTLGSHIAMLTGRYQIAFAPNTTEMRLPREEPTLLTRLRQEGYACAGFTGGGYLEPFFGFGRGCRQYAWPPADAVFSRAAAWIDEHATAPFCLFLHTFEVHDVSLADARVGAMYADPIRFEPFPADDQAHLARHYEARVRAVDARIGALIEHLKSIGHYDNTVIVVVGDHGEGFGEHGLVGHSGEWWLWEETLAVPFIVKPAGRECAAREVRVPVSLVDVTPTVLELAGLAAPSGLDGRSLAPAVHGAPLEPAPVFATMMGVTLAVRDGDWKLVAPSLTRPGQPALRLQLHNLASDLGELRNHMTDEPAAAGRLFALVRQWMARSHAGLRLLVRNGSDPVVVTGMAEAADGLRFAVAAGLTVNDRLTIAPQRQSAEWQFALAPHEERLVIFDAPAGMRLQCAARNHEPVAMHVLDPDGAPLGSSPLWLGDEVSYDRLYAPATPSIESDSLVCVLWHQDPHRGLPAALPAEIPDDLQERLRALGYLD